MLWEAIKRLFVGGQRAGQEQGHEQAADELGVKFEVRVIEEERMSREEERKLLLLTRLAMPGMDWMLKSGNDVFVAAQLAWDEDKPPINRELIQKFGGADFIFTLRMWAARTRGGDSGASHCPPDDYYRERFMVLVESGVMARGKDIPLAARFLILGMQDLRKAGKELGLEKKFRTKVDGAALVAALPGAKTWLEQVVDTDDLFQAQELPLDIDAVEQQWGDLLERGRKILWKHQEAQWS